MNNIIAAVVAFIYNFVGGGIVVPLYEAFAAGQLGDNAFVKVGLNVAYWLVPHPLMSDARRQLVQAEMGVFAGSEGGPTKEQIAQTISSVPGASSFGDILWWAILVVLMGTLVYVAVRRRQV
jgi:hypothetical protein